MSPLISHIFVMNASGDNKARCLTKTQLSPEPAYVRRSHYSRMPHVDSEGSELYWQACRQGLSTFYVRVVENDNSLGRSVDSYLGRW